MDLTFFGEDKAIVNETRHIHQYQIIGKIAEGGMATVYKGYHDKLDREVAIKILLPSLARDADIVQRFLREAKTSAMLDHPNIVEIYEVGFQDDEYFIIMEYIPGTNLRDLLRLNAALKNEQIFEIMTGCCSALSYTHDRGIIHRDIKPENIMLRPNGQIVITDFGIAKVKHLARMTALNVAIGTVEYMSPEQVRGSEVDARSDVFSLGGVFYELVTRKTPFGSGDFVDVATRILSQDPIPMRQLNPDIPEHWEKAILKALRKDASSRFRSMQDFLDEINPGIFGGADKSLGRGSHPEASLSPVHADAQEKNPPIPVRVSNKSTRIFPDNIDTWELIFYSMVILFVTTVLIYLAPQLIFIWLSAVIIVVGAIWFFLVSAKTKPRWKLEVYSEGRLIEAVQLVKTRSLIGRALSAEIQLDDDSVSRNHAELLVRGRKCIIRDLGSENGIFRNEKRVQSWKCKGKERFRIGSFEVRLQKDRSCHNRTLDL